MILKCPYCNGTLKSGEATIHGTVTGFLFVGFSHQNLYFKPESGEEIEVLGSRESTPAMRCEECGVVTLNINAPKQNKRDVIIELLMLCSFKELRSNLEDPKRVIIEKWKESYLPKENELRNVFTIDEQSLLADFDRLIDKGNWSMIENLAQEIVETLEKR